MALIQELYRMAILYIAVYKPRQTLGTYHWTLYLEEGDSHLVFQVVRNPGQFQYQELSSRPENTDRHVENIFVADINDIEGYRAVVNSQAVDNETYHWGCQQWVFDVLESLLDDSIITDYDHGEAKHKLEMIFQVEIEGDE
ncbi:hypothetical protein BDDG_09611 [Blastomyces dermatitidis ATCC 18188]|uniref:Uncharacterized protein n=2 Tax=Ajellomyces dermatitidis (strain ATCC 18188 / CBS 674.68) TaxID=653446 RepID=F2TTV1_AJEDA|nr:hypothetical protein BDDG_09611 [Blastomyces dermatitidis ATCC 18188]